MKFWTDTLPCVLLFLYFTVPATLLAVVGCATVPQTPLVGRQEVTTVAIPVNVRCVSLRELPVIPKTRLEPPTPAIISAITERRWRDFIDIVQRWLIQTDTDFNNLEDYVIRADALLRACATEPQPLTDKATK